MVENLEGADHVPNDRGRSHRYRDEFRDPGRAERYDTSEYQARSWATLVWEQERNHLSSLLADGGFVPQRRAYLDFACGTGRVTELFAPHFESAWGLDISESMLQRARVRVPAAEFVVGDVQVQPDAAPAPFDLITAFRFILNADPGDRISALRWMHAHLRSDASRVVVNNHGNLFSHKVFPHAIRRLRSPRRGSVTGNVLSPSAVRRLVNSSGFEIVSIFGTGFLGGSAMRVVPFERMRSVQHRMGNMAQIRRFGEDQIYVLAPR